MQKAKVLAVVPARGGSKRIVNKNIIDFCGKAMIGWPLTALQQCALVDEVIVSTDSEAIAEVAQRFGAQVPFMRPAELADDFTGTAAVVAHAVDWYRREVGPVDYVLTVYPTAVFLSPEDLQAAWQMLQTDSDCQIVFTGTEFPFPIQRAVYLDEAQRVRPFQPEHMASRSQDLLPAYHDAGQFYLARISTFDTPVSTFSPAARMLVLPRHRVVDIDTPEDLQVAQKLFTLALAEASSN